MPTLRKSPRKNKGTNQKGRYQDSPEATVRKSSRVPSKFSNRIGYKKSTRMKSPAAARKNSRKTSSESSYEYSESENENNKSESDNDEKGLSIDISRKKKTTERRRREERINDDENIDDVENETSSPELAVTKFRKSLWANDESDKDKNYNSDDDSECIGLRQKNNKKRKIDDDEDSEQGGLLTNEMRKKEEEVTKLKRKIKTLESTIMNMRRTSRSTSRDKTGWSGEDLVFVKEVTDFCKNKLYPKTKFLKKNWQEYLPDERKSLYTVCMKHLSIPEGSDKREIWDRVIVPSIRDKYQGMRCNMNNKIKSIYLSMIYLLQCPELIIISHTSHTY
jgi:hypothetical protein